MAYASKESERMAAWQKANPERVSARGKKYRKDHPKKEKLRGANYRARNPQKGRARKLAWKKANPEKYQAQYLGDKDASQRRILRRYGLTIDDYNRMLAAQDGKCKICRKTCPTGRRLSVDHCHKTNRVRGLLCDPCNRGLGSFRDEPERLIAAANYLMCAESMEGVVLDPSSAHIELQASPG